MEELGRQVKASFPNSKYMTMSDAMVGELYARKYRKTGAGAGDGTYTPNFGYSPFGELSILDYNNALNSQAKTPDLSAYRTEVKQPKVNMKASINAASNGLPQPKASDGKWALQPVADWFGSWSTPKMDVKPLDEIGF